MALTTFRCSFLYESEKRGVRFLDYLHCLHISEDFQSYQKLPGLCDCSFSISSDYICWLASLVLGNMNFYGKEVLTNMFYTFGSSHQMCNNSYFGCQLTCLPSWFLVLLQEHFWGFSCNGNSLFIDFLMGKPHDIYASAAFSILSQCIPKFWNGTSFKHRKRERVHVLLSRWQNVGPPPCVNSKV